MQRVPGTEHIYVSMIIECCSQERNYSTFYGLMGERLCLLNRQWQALFEESFAENYETVHRLETHRLRNVAKFFAFLFAKDAINWAHMHVIHLNEDETNASSRIFVKILFQELAETLGLRKLNERLNDPTLLPAFAELFPKDHPRKTRFSINFFTSIGLGALTYAAALRLMPLYNSCATLFFLLLFPLLNREGMREHLKNAPRPPPIAAPMDTDSGSSDDSDDSSDSDSSSDDSDSDSGSSSGSDDDSDSD